MNWKPTQDFAIRFSDQSGNPRTIQQLQKMVDEIKQIANDYDFDISNYGSWSIMFLMAKREHELYIQECNTQLEQDFENM